MLKLNNVSVTFDGKKVIDDTSVSFPDSGLVTINGPSGCGKSTLLRAIMDLQKYKGEIITDENAVISAVFQESNLMPWLTAAENVAAVCDINEENMSRAKQLLSILGLSYDDADKHPNELSVGMMRRVAAARAMMIRSDILILDEPFAGLDENNIITVSNLLFSNKNEQLILLVTHVGNFSADVNYTIKDGKLLQSESDLCRD